MKSQRFDLVVVGAGSGGYAAARTARDLGATVALVDSGALGGLCILRGCMPSKALLASSEAAQRVREAPQLGIETEAPRPNILRIRDRKRALIDEFASYRIEQLERFPLFRGHATFISDQVLRVNNEIELHAPRWIIATGSEIAVPPLLGLHELGYLTSDDILDASVLPRSVAVLGGGYVASELGQYLHRVGVKTTILFRAAHLLSSEDHDIGNCLTEALRVDGLTIKHEVQLERAERDTSGGKAIIYKHQDRNERLVVDEIIHCLGRVPNIQGLNLEEVGVQAHAVTGIEVDETLRTTNPAIFAVGDVTGVYPLVHVAIAQGEVAARNAIQSTHEQIEYRLLKARTIFTDPQVAVVGATERELQQAQIPYLVARYDFADHGKAMTLARTHGFVKMLADPENGQILGASLVGPEASELIHELIVAMHYRATVSDFMRIPHLHPTLAEIWTYPAEELAEMLAAERLKATQ